MLRGHFQISLAIIFFRGSYREQPDTPLQGAVPELREVQSPSSESVRRRQSCV